jgi:hypothetical protein
MGVFESASARYDAEDRGKCRTCGFFSKVSDRSNEATDDERNRRDFYGSGVAPGCLRLVEDFVQSYRWATMRDGVPSNQFVATMLIRISQALTQRRIGTSYS